MTNIDVLVCIGIFIVSILVGFTGSGGWFTLIKHYRLKKQLNK